MKNLITLLIIFCFVSLASHLNAQVGIGTPSPHSSAILDLSGSTNKGFKLPEVNLSTPPATPAKGLMVWNTNGSYGSGEGIYYHDGSAWQKMTIGAGADNLGNHIASENIKLNGNWLSNDGGNEGIRINDDGKVGIGTTGFGARLHVASSGNTATDYTARLQSSSSVAGSGGILFDQNSTYSYKLHTEGTATLTGRLKLSYINYSDGSVLNDNVLVLESGNVGIGKAPVSKLNIQEAQNITLTTFTQGLGSAGLLISTDYTSSAYTPGVFWSTNNDNPTKPKAGIFLRETGGGTHMLFGTSNSYVTGITNTAMNIDPSGNVEVAGVVRGAARYSSGSSSITSSTTSTSTTFNPDISTSVYLYKDDLVKVDLACNLMNSSGNTTYMRIYHSSGSGSWITNSNWITSTGTLWGGGYSTGLFRASADGNCTFQGYWHVDAGTGNAVYCNIIAYLIGR